MNSLRLFVAVSLDPDFKRRLAERLQPLQAQWPKVSWVPEANLHFTLAFLGATAEEDLERIKQALEHGLEQQHAFAYRLAGLGFFPHSLWLDVEQGRDEFCALADRVQQGLKAKGFHLEERAFVPHLTVGRIKSAHTLKDASRMQADWQAPEEKLQAHKVTLFQSVLSARGAAYHPLYEMVLPDSKES
jgi:2'-5' RNA ligase